MNTKMTPSLSFGSSQLGSKDRCGNKQSYSVDEEYAKCQKEQGRVSFSWRVQGQLHHGGENLSLKGWVGVGCTDNLDEHLSERAIKSTCASGGSSSNLGRLKGGVVGS